MLNKNHSTKKLFKIILLFIIFSSCKKDATSNSKDNNIDLNKNELINYLPTSSTDVIVHHNNYSLSYVELYEQAEWVAYELSKEHLNSHNSFERPYFIEDSMVKTKSSNWRNFKNSGYDKGHLCPAGDRKFSKEAFEETFYTSNVSPQLHDFNDGIWNRLEQKVRYWAYKYDGVFVITGGVFSKNMDTIGFENVAVPDYFYKILLNTSNEEFKMIAFLVPHKKSNDPLYNYVTSVDEIETLTGINFFPKLEDALEEKLESSKNYKKWSFN